MYYIYVLLLSKHCVFKKLLFIIFDFRFQLLKSTRFDDFNIRNRIDFSIPTLEIDSTQSESSTRSKLDNSTQRD